MKEISHKKEVKVKYISEKCIQERKKERKKKSKEKLDDRTQE